MSASNVTLLLLHSSSQLALYTQRPQVYPQLISIGLFGKYNISLRCQKGLLSHAQFPYLQACKVRPILYTL